jgi:hypothetical protein
MVSAIRRSPLAGGHMPSLCAAARWRMNPRDLLRIYTRSTPQAIEIRIPQVAVLARRRRAGEADLGQLTVVPTPRARGSGR